MLNLEVVALGTCYVDVNTQDFPYHGQPLPSDTEILGSDYEVVAGGSAVNFCRLLSSLAVSSGFIGLAGKDLMGDTLISLLRKDGVQPFIARDQDVFTNIGFNITNPAGGHFMFVAGTASAALRLEVVQLELEAATQAARLLYMGGCFKLAALQPSLVDIVEITKNRHALLAVDHGRVPAGTPTDRLEAVRGLVRAADYYFPSRQEFCTVWDAASVEAGLDDLAQQAPDLAIIVKDGANGAYYRHGSTAGHVPTQHVEHVVNLTGAGDSFNAGVIKGVLSEKSLPEAVAYGCAVAAAQIGMSALPHLSD